MTAPPRPETPRGARPVSGPPPIVVYLGVGVPVMGVGLLATTTGLLTAVRLFTALVAALCLLDPAAPARRFPAGRGANGLP